jgi:hypothetical protein
LVLEPLEERLRAVEVTQRDQRFDLVRQEREDARLLEPHSLRELDHGGEALMRASGVAEGKFEEPERGPVREHVDPVFVALRQPEPLGRQGARDIHLATMSCNERVRTQIDLARPLMEHIGRHVDALGSVAFGDGPIPGTNLKLRQVVQELKGFRVTPLRGLPVLDLELGSRRVQVARPQEQRP